MTDPIPIETDPGVRTEASTEISHLKFMQSLISGKGHDSQMPFFMQSKGIA